MKKWYLSLLFLFVFYGMKGQSYSGDVELLSHAQGVIVVRTTGIHEKKKEASEMAIKSAFYAYFFSGISGLNNGLPLIGEGGQEKFKDYFSRFFEGGRYFNFVRKEELMEEPERLRSKAYKAVVRLTFSNDALLRDMEMNQVVLTRTDVVPKTIELPSIMVVPYRKGNETFADLLQGDSDRRVAVSVIQKSFINKGVNTNDFEAKYRSIERRALHQADSRTSPDAELLKNSGSDVYVEVDLIKDITAEGARVTMNLKAYETSSGATLASETYISNRFKTNATDKLCYYAIQDVEDSFLKQVVAALAEKESKGNAVVLDFSLSGTAEIDFDTEVGDMGFPLSDVLRMWVKKNAKGGSYHIQGATAESVIFDRVQVPNRSDREEVMDANDFALSLFLYLKKQNVNCEKKVEGNTIYIKIIK